MARRLSKEAASGRPGCLSSLSGGLPAGLQGLAVWREQRSGPPCAPETGVGVSVAGVGVPSLCDLAPVFDVSVFKTTREMSVSYQINANSIETRKISSPPLPFIQLGHVGGWIQHRLLFFLDLIGFITGQRPVQQVEGPCEGCAQQKGFARRREGGARGA